MNIGLCILALYGWTSVIQAESSRNALRYDELCKYDSMCGYLKNRDGSFVQPKDGLLRVMKAMKSPILNISERMGVDPLAVAGSIVAENSMNVQVDDDTHSFLEKIKLNPLANDLSKFIRGKSFSIGFGQIKPETALEVEGLLAKVESRPARSAAEVTTALTNPLENIKYAAAIVRSCQDAYKAHNFDVSKEPGTLASLYNLGQCEGRANRAEVEKKLPRINYFGFFVNHFESEIRKGIGLDERKTESGAMTSARIQKRLTSAVPLLGAPPKCAAAGAGQVGDYNKLATLNYSARSVNGWGPYAVLAPGIDCDMKDWSLIRTERGEVGWISNSNLETHSEDYVKSGGGGCDSKTRETCASKIKTQLGGDYLGTDESGLVEIRLAGGKANREKADFKAFDVSACLAGDRSRGGTISTLGSELIDQNQASDFAKALEAKKSEIISELKLKSFNDPRNPYRDIYSSLADLNTRCTPQCRGDVRALRALIASKPADHAGYDGFKRFRAQFSYVYLPKVDETAPTQPTRPDSRITAGWTSMLGDVRAECQSILPNAPVARERLLKIQKWFEEQQRDGSLRSLDSAGAEARTIPAICRGLNSIKKARAVDPSGTVDLSPNECGQCSVQMTFSNGNQGTSGPIELATLAVYASEDKDYDDILSAALTGLAAGLGQSFSTYQGASCTYDPLATAARIEAISSDPCVESVFAPDYYLVNRFRDRAGGAFYKPFSEDDRFSIRLKDGCTPFGTPSAEAPTGATGADK